MRSRLAIAVLTLFAVADSSASDERYRPSDLIGGARPQYLGINSGFFARWPEGRVRYVYNPTGAPALFADDTYFLGLLGQAFEEWRGVGKVEFEFLGVDSSAGLADFSDEVVVIGWDSLPPGVGGVALVSTGQATSLDAEALGFWPYLDGNITMNLSADWDNGVAELTERDIVQTMLHETGHLLGLGHSDDPESAMFANPYNSLTHVTADDIAAVRGLYGAPELTRLPPVWAPPPAGATTLIGDRWLTIDPPSFPPPPVTTVDDDTAGTSVFVYWQHDSNAVASMQWVLVDPWGYFHNGVLGDHSGENACPPSFTCSKLFSLGRVAALKTVPGLWKVYGIESGQQTVELSLEVNTNPVWNRPPPSAVGFDRSFGVAPLTVTGTVDVGQDPEGDLVTVSWHVPGEGETEDALGAASGQSVKSMSFAEDGLYEVFVTVDDDGARYGIPGPGDAAGPGYRRVFRQLIRVGLEPYFGFSAVPDADMDDLPELAVAIPQASDSSGRVVVKEPVTGQSQASYSVLGPEWQIVAVQSVDSGGEAGVAALGWDGQTIRVEIRGSTTGELVRNVNFFSADWEPVGMVVLDAGGDAAGDLAVLARNRYDGEVAAQVRSASTGAFVRNVFFLNPAWSPVELVAVPGFDANPGDELAVLATTHTGQIVASVKDAGTNSFIRNVFFLNPNFRALDLVVVADVPGESVPALALLARNRETGLIVTMLKSPADNRFIRNLFHLSNAFTPIAAEVVEGSDASPGSELAVLGVADTGKIVVQIKDTGTNAFVRNLFPLGSAWEPLGMTRIGDVDGNSQGEIAVMARRKSDGKLVIQTQDVLTGTQVNLFIP